MKTIDRLKCVLFGHPKGAILHDAEIHIPVTSAKNPFTIGYCTRCGEIVFTELDNKSIVQAMQAKLAREEEERLKSCPPVKKPVGPRADGLDLSDYFVLKGLVDFNDFSKARLDQVRKVVEKMERTWPALQSLPKKPKPPKNVRVKEGKER